MIHASLGPLRASALGLGCMGMSWGYGKADLAEAEATLLAAVDRGVTHFDTAEVYGPFTNEELVGRVLQGSGKRDDLVIATKVGFRIDEKGGVAGTDGRPEHVRAACEASLQRLRVEYIDILYLHRLDRAVPVEETVGAMGELVRAGKVRALGLSEVSAATLRRAHAVHAIAALQSEYSLWERGVEAEVLPACRELGVGFVAYAPLGRGFLTGAARPSNDYPKDDGRRRFPRFQREHFAHNQALAGKLADHARTKGATAAQLAIAWVLAQGALAIPGSRRVAHLHENVDAASLVLDDADRAFFEATFPRGAASGERYYAGAMKLIDA